MLNEFLTNPIRYVFMNKIRTNLFILLCAMITQSCGVYSFSGVSIGDNVETFQVNFFQNEAAIIEPGIDRTFTLALQDRIQDQTSLSLTNANGDLTYEGEIVEYYIAPQSSTSGNTAALNRLTIGINVRYFNNKITDGSEDFERRFSFFSDVPATSQLIGATLDTALEEIYERITQDIFNASLAKW